MIYRQSDHRLICFPSASFPVSQTMKYHHGNLKTAILDTAEEILVSKSLDAVSMRELAKLAGVSPGAPYYHFKNRSGLILALCQRGFTQLGKDLSKAQARGGITSMAEAYLEFAQENPALYQLMFSTEATQDEIADQLHPYADPVFGLLVKEVAKEQGSNRNKLTPISIWCFMHGIVSLRTASPLRAKLGTKKVQSFTNDTIKTLMETL